MDIDAYIKSLRDKSFSALDLAQQTALDALNTQYGTKKNTLYNQFQQNRQTAEQETNTALQNLLKGYEQTKSQYDTQKVDTGKQYYNKINEADANILLKAKRLNEVLAKSGYTSGDSGQAQLMNNVTQQGVIGGLKQEEQGVYDQIARALSETSKTYDYDVTNTQNRLAQLLSNYENVYNTNLADTENILAGEIANIRNQYALQKAQKDAELEQTRMQMLLEQEAQAKAEAQARASRSASIASTGKTSSSAEVKKWFTETYKSLPRAQAVALYEQYKNDLRGVGFTAAEIAQYERDAAALNNIQKRIQPGSRDRILTQQEIRLGRG